MDRSEYLFSKNSENRKIKIINILLIYYVLSSLKNEIIILSSTGSNSHLNISDIIWPGKLSLRNLKVMEFLFTILIHNLIN